MSTPIPEDVMKTARRLAKKAVYHGGVDWATDDIARALMSEREACAVTAAGTSAEFDFGKALAECRDSEYGFHSGRLHAASAIRDRSKT